MAMFAANIDFHQQKHRKIFHLGTPNPPEIQQNPVQDTSGGQLRANLARQERKITEDRRRNTGEDAA